MLAKDTYLGDLCVNEHDHNNFEDLPCHSDH